MVDNPALFPPMSALPFPINKSTPFGTFLRRAPDPDVNLSIKVEGEKKNQKTHERRARPLALRGCLSPPGPLPLFPRRQLQGAEQLWQLRTSTLQRNHLPPPPRAQRLCSSASHRHRPHATSKTHPHPSFYTLIVTLRPDGSISDL